MSGLKRGLFGFSSSSVRAVLADRELMFERASRDARSAEERAERLASDLWDAQRRLGEVEEQLGTAQELGEALAADLERSVAEREAMEGQIIELRHALEEVGAELAVTQASIAGKDEEMRAAGERLASFETDLAARVRERDALAHQLEGAREASAELAENLRQRNEAIVVAQEEASKAQAWLRRALEESAHYKGALTAEQQRVAELDELLATYRAELEERAAALEAERAAAGEAAAGEAAAGEGAAGEGAAEPAPGTGPWPPEAGEGPSTASELAAVLQVTEEAVIRIMESTRARADQELRSVDQDRERILREVEGMRAWRDRAAPMISSLQSTMDEVLVQVSEIGVRVGEVLRPVTGAVARLGSQLASLDSLSSAPRPAPGPASSEGARVIELREDQAARHEQ